MWDMGKYVIFMLFVICLLESLTLNFYLDLYKEKTNTIVIELGISSNCLSLGNQDYIPSTHGSFPLGTICLVMKQNKNLLYQNTITMLLHITQVQIHTLP